MSEVQRRIARPPQHGHGRRDAFGRCIGRRDIFGGLGLRLHDAEQSKARALEPQAVPGLAVFYRVSGFVQRHNLAYALGGTFWRPVDKAVCDVS
jgi:hypothetical protein